jgi:hypothetical protein
MGASGPAWRLRAGSRLLRSTQPTQPPSADCAESKRSPVRHWHEAERGDCLGEREFFSLGGGSRDRSRASRDRSRARPFRPSINPPIPTRSPCRALNGPLNLEPFLRATNKAEEEGRREETLGECAQTRDHGVGNCLGRAILPRPLHPCNPSDRDRQGRGPSWHKREKQRERRRAWCRKRGNAAPHTERFSSHLSQA